MVNPKITVRNMEMTAPIKDYAANKVAKYADLLEKAVHIAIEITELTPHRGVAQDFIVEINVNLPGTLIRVAEKGDDVYAMLDKVSDQMARKLKRYEEKFAYWEGEKSFKELEMEFEESEQVDDQELYGDDYQVQFPKISKRLKADAAPITSEEAIERMELSDSSSWFFKNSETGRYSMVFTRFGDGYGLIEPEE